MEPIIPLTTAALTKVIKGFEVDPPVSSDGRFLNFLNRASVVRGKEESKDDGSTLPADPAVLEEFLSMLGLSLNSAVVEPSGGGMSEDPSAPRETNERNPDLVGGSDLFSMAGLLSRSTEAEIPESK